MRTTNLIAALSGVMFALGLGISGMTQPAKIIGFLDFAGAWDPSMAYVMVGAIGVHMVAALRLRRPGARPLLAPSFDVPPPRPVDGKLIAGALVFGIGWGTSGFCPGPSVVALASFAPSTLLFVVAMLVGMRLHAFAFERRLAAREPTPL